MKKSKATTYKIVDFSIKGTSGPCCFSSTLFSAKALSDVQASLKSPRLRTATFRIRGNKPFLSNNFHTCGNKPFLSNNFHT